MAKLHFLTFDLEPVTLTLDVGHHFKSLLRRLTKSTNVPSLMTVALIVFEKNGKVAFFYI